MPPVSPLFSVIRLIGAHRIKSAGHDLARPIEAIRQIMAGEFRGHLCQAGGATTPVAVGGKFRQVDTWAEAALRLAQHLFADVITPMSLPIPGMSFLYESDSKALRDFALHAYSGLEAGSGWSVRNGIVTPGMTVLVTEILVRTYVHLDVYQQTGTARLDPPQTRRRNELLLASHSLISAISLGKVAAQMTAHYYAGNYVRAVHPSHIRHANIPALLRAGALAGTGRQRRLPSLQNPLRLFMERPGFRYGTTMAIGSRAQPGKLEQRRRKGHARPT